MPRRSKEDSEHNSLENGSYVLENRKLAEEALLSYFSDKVYHRGGSIPAEEICSEHSVNTLLRTRLDDRWSDIIHNQCLSKIEIPKSWSDPVYSFRVHYLVQMMYDAQSKSLSREFIPGLMILYFKFCKGFEVPSPPPFR